MSHTEALRNQPIPKLLWTFSLPAIVGMLVNATYNVVDRIYIGKLGALEMTGIGLSMPLMTIMLAFGMLIGIGSGAVVSIRLGQQKKEEADRILGNAIALCIYVMTAVMILGLIFKRPLLYLFGASEATIGFADDYLGIILLGSIFQGLGFAINNLIRAEGNPKIAMFTMLLGAITNIAIAPIFIFVFGLGIKGAAIATVLSQLLSMTWVLAHFFSGKSHLKFKKENLKLDPKLVKSIFAIGMSPFSLQIAASVVAVLANHALRSHGGDIAISAMTVINALAIFILMPIFGINQGVQPIIGFNYGARQYDRVKEALKLAIGAATCITVTGFFLTQFLAPQLIGLFNNSPELLAVAVPGLKTFLMMLPVIGFQIVSTNYFQAVGKAPKAMFLSLLRQVIVLIPMLMILPQIFGLSGVWMAGPISDGIAALMTGAFLWYELRLLDRKHEAQ